MPPSIMWFRRDLRLSDNPALVEAARSGDGVVPLFCIDSRLHGASGARRVAFLHGCLRALDRSIDGHLIVRHGDPVAIVPALAQEVGAMSVHVAEDFGPYGRARDEAVSRALDAAGVDLVRTGSPYAVPPGSILNRAGEHYKVFTPFARAWREHGWPAPVRAPSGVRWRAAPSDGIPDDPDVGGARLPTPGERAASNRLAHFLRAKVDGYADRRDDPGADATSRLSPDLKWGTLHPRQVLARLGRSAGARTFEAELCWREFYADVLHHVPASARESMDERVGAMPWDRDAAADERFDAWTKGTTGYPIVDAGMRQLLAEGWMHNRVRMIVASFLVKDLHLDWQRGARWFMAQLVDGDLASNQHGWQWTAGTGTDAAPYFRVFNPVAQGRRHDPDGTYVRRYVPELRRVDAAYVHAPWERDGGPPDGYPQPIVDHAEERAEALRRYEARPAPAPDDPPI